jgi:hypothetical protein
MAPFQLKISIIFIKSQNLKLVISISLLLLCFKSFTQQLTRSVIGGMGNSVSKGGMILQSTVGQPAITGTEKSENGLIIRQGFQQSYSTPGSGMQNLNISLYPNPNNGEFLFRTDLNSDDQFQFYINDSFGRNIINGYGSGSNEVFVNMKNSENGVYFLTIKTTFGSGIFKISKTL